MANDFIRLQRGPSTFVVVERALLGMTNISWRAKGLYCFLLSLSEDERIRVRDVVEAGRDGRDAVYAGLAELVDSKLASRFDIREGGKFAGTEFHILPVPHTAKPYTANQYTVASSHAPDREVLSLSQVSENERTTENKKQKTNQKTKKLAEGFGEFWRAYPKRLGGNSKANAEKQWRARINQGHKPAAMIDGTYRYAIFCESKGNVGTEFVMMAQTFLGPGLHFMQEWEVGGNSNRQQKQEDSNAEPWLGNIVV